MAAEPSSFDSRLEIVRRATAAGVVLPRSTVDELGEHLEDVMAAALANGASEDEARRAALAALDEAPLAPLRRHAARNPERLHARLADAQACGAGGRSLNVLSAIRLAIRQFRQHPSFALITVLVLGLGTGAATTVFTVVDSVILRPLPYAAPDRLVTLWDTNIERGLAHEPISPVNFMDYRALPVFDDAAAWWVPSVNLVDPGQDPVRVNTIEASGNIFAVLGVTPQLGDGLPGDRFFFPNERIVAISDRLWRNRYKADHSIVGRQLMLNGKPWTVVGVMPARFNYPGDIDVWQRLQWDPHQHSRDAHFMNAVLRLKDGTTLSEAQSATETLATRLQNDFSATNKAWSARLVPLLDDTLGYYRPALMVLFGAVGLLLFIGCLNVASLLLTRALSREKEMAVRVAMGAAPRQLVIQLLAESGVLSVAGALVGIGAAAVALPLLVALTPVDIPRLEEATVNLRALAGGLIVIVTNTIFFGLVPALVLLKGQLVRDLRSGERGSSRGARRIYSVLVAGEVALACALLVSSALLVRTVGRMVETPTGIHADDVVISSVQLPNVGYADWRTVAEVHGNILQEIRRQPGVQSAGGSASLPLDIGWRTPFGIYGTPAPARPEDAPQAQLHSVSDGYFATMQATLAAGRDFTEFDFADSTGVVIVNERFAARYFPGENVVGRVVTTSAGGIGVYSLRELALGLNLVRIRPRPAGTPPSNTPPDMPPTRFEIVGVVRDVRNVPFGQAVEPAIYFPTRQFAFREQFVAVRASDRNTAIAAIRQALANVAPGVPMNTPLTWGERFAARTAQPRMLMAILMAFGGLAALLAALGVYGLFSWSVALRKRELAIRLTLGAKPAEVGTMVVRHSATLVAIGLIAGVVIVQLARGALSRVLYEVSPSDATSTVAAGGLLLVAALVACIPPALRAMRVDPVEGLRAE